jgi:uncharacterized protein YyaL (SSP411 family)
MTFPVARQCSVTLVVLAGLSVSSSVADTPKEVGKPKYTNRLARETSPYLLMHAHNPTDWYPWGPEAFAKAKKEGKLIFLSIGYSSCYWCHVMERESFNNEAVAKLLNDSFVCVKVDREERPDIDQIYMTALQVQRQSGGWPLSMFLLPDGRPVAGGTYWPPEDRKVDDEVVRGFKSVLKLIQGAFKDNPKDLEEHADKLAAATRLSLENARPALVDLDRKLVAETTDALKEEFDPEFGGFGNPNKRFKGPKFPMPCRLEFLLQQGERTADKALVEMVGITLDRMALGGIYDQIGGGFHRYSTERTWNVPHFEKMLYDNAQLAEVYAHAYRLTKKPQYRRILEETLAYVQREMMSPEGAFYSSQDAETHHEEGRFYVWTPEELAAALPAAKDLAFIRKVYGADGKPSFEGKYFILSLPKTPYEAAKEMKLSVEEFYARLKPLRQRLFEARDKRDKPFLNKIALTGWSGQMIAGFAAAGAVLDEPKYIEVAKKSATFVLKHQRTPEGRLLRTYGAQPGQQPKAAVPGYLEDYAFLVHGLLILHDASKDKQLLAEARALTDKMIAFHGDNKSGAYYFTAHDGEKFFARSKDQFDGAQPAANSLAARNLVRLWVKTGEEKYRAEAERTFRALAGPLKAYPAGLTALASALDLYIDAVAKKKQ